MKSITVYDPAMCCSTGVCGPAPDSELAQLAGDLERLAKQGVEVVRYNLAQQPQAFTQGEIRALLAHQGLLALPAVFVDGRTVLVGRYPTSAELDNWHSGNDNLEVEE
ncbi:MAG TPA: arsenite efflux transporter metallochaperone ArsD [Syntrophomonadaceae bacterium]|nr:arsenite efflux transporter metallochaperone ArsD [Syntrophomonadaceae bacterium]